MESVELKDEFLSVLEKEDFFKDRPCFPSIIK